MSVALSITVSDRATPAVAALAANLAPGGRRGLMDVLGRTAEREYKRWFRVQDASRVNQMGFPRSHFWNRLAQAANYDPARTTESIAIITLDPATAGKIFGGTWGAKEAKFICIPLVAEAYGRSPKDFPLRFVPNRRGGNVVGWLVQGTGDATVYWYRLQLTVTLSPDPQALPPPSQVEAALGKSAGIYLRPGGAGGVN